MKCWRYHIKHSTNDNNFQIRIWCVPTSQSLNQILPYSIYRCTNSYPQHKFQRQWKLTSNYNAPDQRRSASRCHQPRARATAERDGPAPPPTKSSQVLPKHTRFNTNLRAPISDRSPKTKETREYLLRREDRQITPKIWSRRSPIVSSNAEFRDSVGSRRCHGWRRRRLTDFVNCRDCEREWVREGDGMLLIMIWWWKWFWCREGKNVNMWWGNWRQLRGGPTRLWRSIYGLGFI